MKINEPLLLACFKIDTIRYCVFSLNGIAEGLVAFKTRLDIINADEMKADMVRDIFCFHRQHFFSTGITHSQKVQSFFLGCPVEDSHTSWISLTPSGH